MTTTARAAEESVPRDGSLVEVRGQRWVDHSLTVRPQHLAAKVAESYSTAQFLGHLPGQGGAGGLLSTS